MQMMHNDVNQKQKTSGLAKKRKSQWHCLISIGFWSVRNFEIGEINKNVQPPVNLAECFCTTSSLLLLIIKTGTHIHNASATIYSCKLFNGTIYGKFNSLVTQE